MKINMHTHVDCLNVHEVSLIDPKFTEFKARKRKNKFNEIDTKTAAKKKKFTADFYLWLCGTESILLVSMKHNGLRGGNSGGGSTLSDPNGAHTHTHRIQIKTICIVEKAKQVSK